MTTPTTPPLDTGEIRRRHPGNVDKGCIPCDTAKPCEVLRLCDALDAAREELAEARTRAGLETSVGTGSVAAARTVPPASEGATHHEGCWRDRGHHACAIARVEEARKVLNGFDVNPIGLSYILTLAAVAARYTHLASVDGEALAQDLESYVAAIDAARRGES